MNREIKFRSKRIDNNEWIIGNLVMVCDGESLRRYPCIVISYNHDTFNWFEVHSESVGQFTGLHDKNGKEIYEWDIIVMDGIPTPTVISWNKHYASFCIDRKGWMYNHWFGESCDPEECEIIGNIFENPELINK